MMKKETRGFWKVYLVQYKHSALCISICAMVFLSVFWLYRIPIEAVVYALILCALILLTTEGIRFFKIRTKHRQLLSLSEQTHLECDHLPKAETVSEEDYRQLVLKWFALYQEEKNGFHIFKEKSEEYYVTWVHQVKTPIAVMRLMLQEEDTEKNRQLLLELSRIEQYADMALDYFRLEHAGRDMVIKEYELDPIIRSGIRKYASWFVAKKLSLIYEGTDKKAITDQKWLAMMLEQLLSNAVKYTESGCIEITVKDGPEICIRDTGIGIAKEDIPRIFERGFTGYNGRTNKKSTGIGLYLVKKAAVLAGAGIHVESSVGSGTCFFIRLQDKPMVTD